eukprot:scaffold5297_cov108-Skeletonema_marinoi.AAC.7
MNDYQINGKIYGDLVKKSDRILNTFLDQPKSTGTLLVGEKGSGKTLLAKYIFIAAKERGIHTISIQEPVIVLMDEFEKVYTTGADEHGRWRGDANYQAKLLTLLDGVYSSRKLFLLTSNSKNSMDSHMMNRPGRLYYMLEFNGLDASFVEEYCEDNLVQKEYIPAAMVEDMNRYKEGPAEVLKYLNVRPDERGNNGTVQCQLNCQWREEGQCTKDMAR